MAKSSCIFLGAALVVLLSVFGNANAQTTSACKSKADIVFIIDSSNSIGVNNWRIQLQFLANVSSRFTIGPDDVQIGAIVFSTNVQNVIPLNMTNNNADLQTAISNIEFLDDMTSTADALAMARTLAFTPANGARNGVARLAIVITDGASDDGEATAREATLLKNANVTVIAIGVGTSGQTELNTIASSDRLTFKVNNFTVLEPIQEALTASACNATAPQAPCPADIMFIIDSSNSIGPINHQVELTYLANLTARFMVGPNNNQFSALVYSKDVKTAFGFNSSTSLIAVQQAIQNIVHLDDNTSTDLALKMARQMANSTSVRTRSMKMAIVLTDGDSNDRSMTAAEAALLKGAGVTVFSIGIGNYNQSELLTIATQSNYVFPVNNYNVATVIKNLQDATAC